MPRPHRSSTCWEEPCLPVALSRNPQRHVRLAQDLLDAIPESWDRVHAYVIVDGAGGRRYHVDSLRPDLPPPDLECLEAVHDAICDLASNAIMPQGLEWVGVWVDYDIDADILVSRIMHGGQCRSPAAIPATPVHDGIPDVLRRSGANGAAGMRS